MKRYSDAEVTKLVQILMKLAKANLSTRFPMKHLDALARTGFLLCVTRETHQYRSIQTGEKIYHVPGQVHYELSQEGFKLLEKLSDPLTRLLAVKELREKLNDGS